MEEVQYAGRSTSVTSVWPPRILWYRLYQKKFHLSAVLVTIRALKLINILTSSFDRYFLLYIIDLGKKRCNYYVAEFSGRLTYAEMTPPASRVRDISMVEQTQHPKDSSLDPVQSAHRIPLTFKYLHIASTLACLFHLVDACEVVMATNSIPAL